MMTIAFRTISLFVLAYAVCSVAPAVAADCAKLLGEGNPYWYCRAETERKDVHCASIRGDEALYRTCLALTRNKAVECNAISNVSQRELCRARSGG